MKTVNRSHGKLLVVDDVTINRDLLSRYFGARGFQIVEADCGLTALNTIKQQHIDAVLLDIFMPGLDGIEVLKRIRVPHEDRVTGLHGKREKRTSRYQACA